MQTVLQDLRYGVRMLLKKPGFTLIALVTLGLGIGATTAIFSVVNLVLLRPLPYQQADRLVVIWEKQQNVEQESPSYPNFLDWQAQSQSFEEMAIARRDSVNLTGAGDPERLVCRQVSANFFATLGVQPQLGRTLTREEDQSGANPVALLSHRLWQQRFGGDAGILNKTLTLSDRLYTVIGVLPPDFQFYTPADVFISFNQSVPERLKQAREEHGGVVVVGRLKPQVTTAQAYADLDNIAVELERAYPRTNTTNRVFLRSIYDDQVGDVKPSLLILFGAVGFVLLIACANVGNLLLARATSRQREVAIRAALGASRARVLRQMLTESLLLALSGGAIGLLLAAWGKDLLVAGIVNDLPWVQQIPLDRHVLLFAIGISLVTGVVFGLAPALQSSKLDLTEALKEGNKGAGRGRHGLRNLLVVTEVAVALLLFVGAGLMLRSFALLNRVDTGFDSQNLLTMSAMLSPTRYSDEAKVRGFYEELKQRIQTLPGVRAVAFSTSVPLRGASVTNVVPEGQTFSSYGEGYLTVNSLVSEDYFNALGLTLLKGRGFTALDRGQGKPLVTVIDENMARDLFADKDPIGQALYLQEGTLRFEVVGVVNHIRHLSYDADEQSSVKYQMYGNLAQIPAEFAVPILQGINLVVRTDQDPAPLVSAIHAQVSEIDRDQLIYNTKTMRQVISETMSQRRFLMLLLGLFAGLAITMAIVGIYGVISYTVTQRTPEIGIRMALGASVGDVLKLVIGQGMRLTFAGIGIGLIAAYLLTRLLTRSLFGVKATDPLTFMAVALILAGVALVACLVPARRAANTDPLIALRYE